MEAEVAAPAVEVTQATPVTGESPEGKETQATQTTEQKPAVEVTQETKESEEKHRSRAYRRLDRWRQRAIEAEANLKAYRELQGTAQTKKVETPVEDGPQREQFATYEEFLRAEARHVASKEAKDAARKEAEAIRKESEHERTQKQQRELSSKFDAHYQRAADEIEDFEDFMNDADALNSLSKIFGPDKQLANAAIMDAENKGPLILYHLAKNPAEAERISKLSPSKQVAAIVALEDKVAKPAKQPSKAPEPIAPVGQKAEIEKDPAKMTQAEFNAWRRKSMKR